MTAPVQTAPAAQTPEARYKVHASYVWLGSAGAVIALLFALLVTSGGSVISYLASGDPDALVGLIATSTTLFGFIMIAAIIIASRFFAYKHLYFTLSADEFCLCSGIFNKQQVHVPYPRIQSVDQNATLLQRIFGVCTVSIDTAGGASNKAVQVPYLTKAQAEWLRTQLFTHKMQAEQAAVANTAATAPATPSAAAAAAPAAQTGNVLDAGKQVWDEVGGIFAGAPQASQAVSYQYGLTNKELILAGISNNSAFAVIVVAILGVLAEALPLLTDVFGNESAHMANDLSSAITRGDILNTAVLSVVGVAVGIMVIIWVLSIIGSCVNYGGFQARRRGARIEVEHGLLQHALQGVDISRVQAVVIKQTFIRRLMGYCELSLSRVGAVSGDQTDSSQKNSRPDTGIVIHPFLKLSRVNEVLFGIVPEYQDVPQTPTPVSPKAMRRGLIRRALWQGSGFWCAVITCAVQIITHFLVGLDPDPYRTDASAVLGITDVLCAILYVLAVVLLVFDVTGAILWAKGSSFAHNRRFMQITNAGLSRETVNFPRQKIQYGCVRTNPLQRAAGTATICARTAAGVGGTTFTLIDVTQTDADAWLSWLEPRHMKTVGLQKDPVAEASAFVPAGPGQTPTQGA